MTRLATIPCSTGDIVLDLDESDAWDGPMVIVHQPRFSSAPYMVMIPVKKFLEAADRLREKKSS